MTVSDTELQDRFRGCLLGGAVGDALGAPVEFMRRAEILSRFGPRGITQLASAYGRVGAITDDTQMTLFTAEGLLRAWVRGQLKGITTYPGVTRIAYLRWLHTQGEYILDDVDPIHSSGWLIAQRELHARRAPGNTCLAALREKPTGLRARNDSKGCGGVMRVAPVGLFGRRAGATAAEVFARGEELAAITHGHPTGSLAAGAFAVMVYAVLDRMPLTSAVSEAKACLRTWPAHEETLRAIEQAEELAGAGLQHDEAIARLGQGWIAEEALAIGLYCALVARDFEHGVVLAVNHDGDSDSTGSIAGNLLGALLGERAIPPQWLEPLELRGVITEVADDLFGFRGWPLYPFGGEATADQIWRKYPGA